MARVLEALVCVLVVVKAEVHTKHLDDYDPTSTKVIPMEKLNLWIDGKETEQFVGMPMDIFVIREGAVIPYLQNAYFDNNLPPLPPEVSVVKLTWQAKDDIYTYVFTDLRSLDPMTLYDPLLSVAQKGFIPRSRTEFEMAIPCTGRVTAIASMYIKLDVFNSKSEAIPGSPIKLHLRKRCFAFDSRAMCRKECENGGKCNSQGQCECTPGFYGDYCQLAVCFPACQNNATCVKPQTCQCLPGFYGPACEYAECSQECQHGGTCVLPDQCECTPEYYGQFCTEATGKCPIPCKNGGTCTWQDKCECPAGYMGEFCQKPICRRSCGVHGRCVDIDVCECYRGWRGRYCHKTVNRMSKKGGKRKRRKKDNGNSKVSKRRSEGGDDATVAADGRERRRRRRERRRKLRRLRRRCARLEVGGEQAAGETAPTTIGGSRGRYHRHSGLPKGTHF